MKKMFSTGGISLELGEIACHALTVGHSSMELTDAMLLDLKWAVDAAVDELGLQGEPEEPEEPYVPAGTIVTAHDGTKHRAVAYKGSIVTCVDCSLWDGKHGGCEGTECTGVYYEEVNDD